MKRISFFAIAALAAVACGGTSGGDVASDPSANSPNPPAAPPAAPSASNAPSGTPLPTPPPSSTPLDYCTDVIGAGTTFLDRCCAADKTKKYVTDTAAILSMSVSQCNAVYGASAYKGRLVTGPNHVQCLGAGAAIAASGCTDFSQTIESIFFPDSPLYTACRGAYLGTQDIGAPCLLPEECKPGLACTGYVAPSDKDPGKEGTCGAPPALSQACGPAELDHVRFSVTSMFADHPECEPGARCDFGTCVARMPAGSTCFEPDECIEGTSCIVGVCTAGGQHGEGQACKEERDCAFPLECISKSGKCEAPKSAGGACDGNNKECAGFCDTNKCASICGSR
jgi:hypothetical protein